MDFEQFTSSWEEFTTLLRSGGVFYGGLIAAVLVCIYQLRKHKLPLWQSGDLFAPGIALGYMVGRLGCLLAGCCYGRPTDVAWAITFTDPAANLNVGTPLNTPLHPTQLYEAVGCALIAVFLWTRRKNTAIAGRLFQLYLLLYLSLRLVLELVRGDARPWHLGLSVAQVFCLCGIAFVLIRLRMLVSQQAPQHAELEHQRVE